MNPQRPTDHVAEYPLHRFIIPVQASLHCGKILFLLFPFNAAEIKRRQPGLQRHENGKHTGQSTITLAKRVYEHQLNMHHRQSECQFVHVTEMAGRKLAKGRLFKLSHQHWNVSRSRKREISLTEVYLAIRPCPCIDTAEPKPVHSPDIRSPEAMIYTVTIHKFILCTEKLPRLNLAYLALPLYTEEIFQDASARSRLKLPFDQC